MTRKSAGVLDDDDAHAVADDALEQGDAARNQRKQWIEELRGLAEAMLRQEGRSPLARGKPR